MYHNSSIFTLLFTLLAISAFAQKQYTLEELQAHPDFEVSVEANGAYSGNSIVLRIISDHRKNIEVFIPAGTVFFTSDEHDQILIIVEDELLAVTKKKTRRKTLDGFCTEASDGIPGDEMAMDFMPTKREKLQQLATFINTQKGLDEHVIQEAVWCVSDNHPVSYIYSDEPEKSMALTKFVAELTGQEEPWHFVKRRHTASGGYIRSAPLFVSGRVEFATTQPTTLKSKIIDADGNLVVDNPESNTIPKTRSARLNFKLTVAGWESGTYYVVYYDQDEKVLLKKAFEI